MNFFRSFDGLQIAYADAGNGIPILLVHGVPTSSFLFRKMILLLVKKGYRVVAPDLLGYGKSDKPSGYEVYNHGLQAKRIKDLMDHLGIQNWTQVCHDMGGMVTWELLKEYPERVHRLILLNTIIYQAGFHPPIKMKRNLLTKIYAKWYCSPVAGPSIVRATFKNGLSKTRLSNDDLKYYSRSLFDGSHHAIYYFFSQTGLPLPDFTNLLCGLNFPVEVIWGTKDKMLVWKDQAEKIVRDLKLKDTNVHLLMDSNHFLPEEDPEKIVQIITG